MKRLALVLLFFVSSAHAADLRDFGAIGDGVTDTTAAFNQAIAFICHSDTERTIRIPVGRFVFLSAPDPIPCAVNLLGEGASVTALIREYDAPPYHFLKVIGGGDPYGGGSIRDLTIDAGHFNGGIGLWVQAQLEGNPTVVSRNPHGLLVDNVYITAVRFYPKQGSWAYGFYIDGSLNANPPAGVAPGIRFIRLHSVSVSRYTILPYLLNVAYGTRIAEAECFIPLKEAPYSIYIMTDANTTAISSASCSVIRN